MQLSLPSDPRNGCWTLRRHDERVGLVFDGGKHTNRVCRRFHRMVGSREQETIVFLLEIAQTLLLIVIIHLLLDRKWKNGA